MGRISESLLTLFVEWVVDGGMMDRGQGRAPCHGGETETQIIRIGDDLGLGVREVCRGYVGGGYGRGA